MEDIILYGIGLEGEKFWVKYHEKYNILYCLDRKQQNSFHGIPVFGIEQKREELKNHKIVVTPVGTAYLEIKRQLEKCELKQFDNFISSKLIEKKLVTIYGNCHMYSLAEYLTNNCYFTKKYFPIYHYIGDEDIPSVEELKYCSIFITQDIRENNEFGMPSAQELCNLSEGQKITLPNLYGCNLFFPQCYNPNDGILNKHLEADAIHILDKDEAGRRKTEFMVNTLGRRDRFIDTQYCQGRSLDEIENGIENEMVFDKYKIIENFENEISKLKQRERYCDIQISDFIIKEFKNCQLFYDPAHPTERVIIEKGRRILKLMNIPIDETVPIRRSMGTMEVPIYGCVRQALGLKFPKDCFLRRNHSATLCGEPENLREYIDNYIKWVWKSC